MGEAAQSGQTLLLFVKIVLKLKIASHQEKIIAQYKIGN